MDYAETIRAQAEALAEYLYGHTRAEAEEWCKEDKFEDKFKQAQEMLEIVVRAVRAGESINNVSNGFGGFSMRNSCEGQAGMSMCNKGAPD